MKDKSGSRFRLIGKQPLSGVGLFAVWPPAADYAFPAAGQQMELYAASANDAAAGTGIRSVEIVYLDSNYAEKRETIATNGNTVVPTVATDILRVNSMRAKTVGSGKVAAGLISLRNLVDTPVYAQIFTGDTEAMQCIYTVPAGRTLYIEGVSGAAGGAAAGKYANLVLLSNWDRHSDTIDLAGNILYPLHQLYNQDSAFSITFPRKIRVPEKATILAKTIGAATTFVSYIVDGEEVMN